MSCIHIQGTRRIGNDAPLSFTGKKDRTFEIEQNAKHENPKVRAAAAAHPMAPEHVLTALAEDGDAEVRAWVARNPRCPGTLLAWLSTDDDPRVRTFVAWNSNTSSAILNFLAQDDNEVVRNMVKIVLDNAS